MKRLTLLCITLLVAMAGNAQFRYTFSSHTSPYTPLVNDTVVSEFDLWQFRKYSMPLGFNFLLDSMNTTEFNFYYCNLASRVMTGVSSGFHITDAQLMDRGNLGPTTPKSPISYVVSGAPGSRVFKMQMRNAGFIEEWVTLGTSNDSMSAQVWYYEGTNVVEIHYGPSRVTFPSLYYAHGGPLIGFIKNVDLTSTTPLYDWIYYVAGTTAAPRLDSVPSTGFSSINPVASLPAAGTVYRFAPKVRPATFITEIGQAAAARAYYNGNGITITSPADATYSIATADGKIVASGRVVGGCVVMELANAAAGIYMVVIQTGSGGVREKIVVLR